MRTQKNKPGFTLVELLVVIAVIAILAGLLLPVLSKSRAHGQGAQCVNNLKQLATAIQMYADEHGDRLPGPLWQGLYAIYFDDPQRMPYYIAPYLGLPAASSEVRTANVAVCTASIRKAPPPVWNDPRSLDEYLSYIVSIAVTNLTSDVVTRPFGYPYGALHGVDEQSKKAHEIRNPSGSWAITDADQMNAAMQGSYYLYIPQTKAHGKIRNQLFFDWHVEKQSGE